MSVRIVSHTKPVSEEFGANAAEFLSYVARVSNPGNQQNFSTAGKLLKYCMDNAHWSVFEHVFITMEIKTTRDISRQIIRHRSFTFSEFSQRYAEVDDWQLREPRMQDRKNRQNSIECEDPEFRRKVQMDQARVWKYCKDMYDKMIRGGIAKEQARAVLPEGLTRTTLYMTGSLRSWMHYIELRRGNGTQQEHREIAELCASNIEKYFPIGDLK